MKTLSIPQLKLNNPSLDTISNKLDEIGRPTPIDTTNWDDYLYKPLTSFNMAYDEKFLYLKFYVEEEHARAVETEPNGNVWEDSCCEFFCSFDDKGYYNLETNCIGTQLLGWGKKGDRERANDSTIHAITKYSTLGNKPFESTSGSFKYQITLKIPATSFFAHEATFRPGDKFRANFYKCGDKTEIPHFLSWNPIDVPKPDFHQPDFFGQIVLGE